MKRFLCALSSTLLMLAFSACKKNPSGNFIRPELAPGEGQYRSMLGKTATFISNPVSKIFSWSPGISTKGRLEFMLIIEAKPDPTGIIFVVNHGKRLLYRQVFLQDQFKFIRNMAAHTILQEISIPLVYDDSEPLTFAAGFHRENPTADVKIHIGDLKIRTQGKPQGDNVILISVDTLRADYVGSYGRTPNIVKEKSSFSPAIDLFADEGVRFENAFTTISATWPALSSLFLSLHPFQHGVLENGMPLENQGPGLASILFKNGWISASYRSNAFSLQLNGFDRVESFFTDRRLFKKALKFIEANRNQRFFFWMHLIGVHADYAPTDEIMAELESKGYPGKVSGKSKVLKEISNGQISVSNEDINHIRRLYAGELIQVDRFLKTFFAKLKSLGLADRTLVIFISDHGEDLYQHHRYFFHHPSLYQTTLHIPLIIRFPRGKFPKTIGGSVSIMDIMPTVLDYLDIDPPAGIEGRSLLPLLSGKEKKIDRPLISEAAFSQVFALTKGSWRLIYNPTGIVPLGQFDLPYPFEKMELYNFQTDPDETNNLALTQTAKVRELTADLLRGLRERKFRPGKKFLDKNNLPESIRRELETLGYL